MVFGTYIGNVRFRAFPMYCYFGFSRRYIGIEISMPIPMYVGPNLSTIYIGMGQYMLLPMYRQISPSQNTSEFKVFSQSRCISINFPRIYLHLLAIYSRASGDHYVLRGDSIRALSMWQRGLLILFDWGFFGEVWKVLEGWIHRDCLILWSSNVFFFLIHRNLIFLMHPDVFLYFSDMNSLFSVEFINP